MRNILFIGGAGFIGSNLIRAINKDKYNVTVLDPEGAYTERLKGLDLFVPMLFKQ